MVVNPKKFQIMFLGFISKRGLRINIEGTKIPMTKKVNFLGVEIVCKLKFEGHVKTVYFNFNQTISAFTCLNSYISRDQARSMYYSLVLSNFNYYLP